MRISDWSSDVCSSDLGAIAILIRSIGTDNHRQPHTGVQMWADGVKPIPAAALSVPDAEQLARMVSRGQPVRLHLTLTSKMLKEIGRASCRERVCRYV